MRPSLAAEDAVLMLNRQYVHLIDVEKVGGAAIRAQVGVADLESDTGWIRMTPAGVVHGEHERVGLPQFCNQRIREVRRKGGNPALAGQMIPESREPSDVTGHGSGDWFGRPGHRTVTFSARGPFGPWPTVNDTVWPSRRSSNGIPVQADW